MGYRTVPLFAAVGVLVFGLAWASPAARADLPVSAAVGGAPTGVNYVNFDNLTAFSSAGGTSGGIGVSFTPDGMAVQGTSGTYAAPYLSNNSGALFGSPPNFSGPDPTTYLSTGVGSVTLTMPAPEMYLGLLWGSVDAYNTLSFYGALGNLVGIVTGSDVTASANGDQGVDGTFYVNINTPQSFTTVVATSSQYAFEFDNVAYNSVNVASVPEPATIFVFGAGLLGLGFISVRRSARKCAE